MLIWPLVKTKDSTHFQVFLCGSLVPKQFLKTKTDSESKNHREQLWNMKKFLSKDLRHKNRLRGSGFQSDPKVIGTY